MVKLRTTIPWLKDKGEMQLTKAQKRAYKLEAVTNFRWIAKSALAKKSAYVLSAKDIAPEDVKEEIAQLGQFAEVAHGIYDQALIWKHLDLLTRPDYPLELHDALQNSILLSAFRGRTADVPATLVYREDKRQLVFAFSGTATFIQALHDMDSRKVKYHTATEKQGLPKVHRGFWRMYRGLRQLTLKAIADGLEEKHGVQELVITGHSMGSALSHFLILDLLDPSNDLMKPLSALRNIVVKLVFLGSPRVGNSAFAELFRDTVRRYRTSHGESSVIEYSVKAYNDGVPALPPHRTGYRHVITSTYYLHHGCLYTLPESESECSNFEVTHDEPGYDPESPLFPLGGHNYYNGRDMERTARRMLWVDRNKGDGCLAEDWEEKYLAKLAKEKRKLEEL